MLARTYLEPEAVEEFIRPASPDLLLVIQLSGAYRIESRRPGGWAVADYAPGAMGAVAPGGVPVLRWRPTDEGRRASTLHLHLAAELVRETAEAIGRPRALEHLPDALLLEDRAVLATGLALRTATEHGSPALAADGLAQALAAQLLRHAGGLDRVEAGALGAPALARAVGYMRDHLAEAVTLDQLAAEVHLSKYHFLRTFTRATGTTPHRYLTRLRLERAAQLLRGTQLSVADVAYRCGWRSSGHFTEAFTRRYGATPERYRRTARA